MFQSTPSGGKATSHTSPQQRYAPVSIHAFRGEGDRIGVAKRIRARSFNPRLPGGRRLGAQLAGLSPVWGFNPRLPGGRRRVYWLNDALSLDVSIHAFRGEGDQFTPPVRGSGRAEFQSTPSGGKATSSRSRNPGRNAVSIHAFRGEGDRSTSASVSASVSFNPRLPGGRRPHWTAGSFSNAAFQSTPSGGKATASTLICTASSRRFNPRLPGGRRRRRGCEHIGICCFNPRLPGGRRPNSISDSWILRSFQSTPSGGKATRQPRRTRRRWVVSIHAFRGEGDLRRCKAEWLLQSFNPRLPGGRRHERRFRQAALFQFQSTPSGGKAT